MDILHHATTRHTAKAFDPARKIPEDLVTRIETLLRCSPSSTNLQPWHFVLAATDEGKARIARAATSTYAYNEPKIRNASHVVVFCTRAAIDENYLQTLLDQEARRLEIHHRDLRLEQRGLHPLALAGDRALLQRDQRADRPVEAGR